jgi:solute carrier family 25 (adenine nucleotide translocator) protein 4/5/6/31
MPEKNLLVDLAAGGISGAVSKSITAPIEKIKLAIQNQASNPRILSGEMQPYTGMLDCGRRHVSELGVSSLWRGNVANCVRYVPTAGCNLAFKDFFKSLFPKYNPKTEFGPFFASQVGSGSLAGAATNTIVYPLIYVRTVLGADLGKVKKYSGMGDCITKTIKSNGFLSLYNGIGASSIGIVVYRGTQFGLQDTIKAFNPYQKDFTFIGLISKFMVAQVAVSVSGITAYPFDTIQRRLQIEASKPKADQMYTSMIDCVKKIHSVEGTGGFFKGALANIVRGTGAAIVLVMYDEIQNFIALQK